MSTKKNLLRGIFWGRWCWGKEKKRFTEREKNRDGALMGPYGRENGSFAAK